MLVDDVPVTPVHPHERPFIVFPPFPEPPPGAKIPIWSEFKPAGIQVVLDPDSGEIEHDGRGIPVVRLASSHSLTPAERMKHKSNKKMKKTTVGPDGVSKRMTWYEDWDEFETTRRANIDPALDRIGSLYSAALEFKTCRPWPPPLTESNPLLLWDYWRHYLGLISQIQSEPKKSKQQDQLEDEDEDDGGDADAPEGQTTVTVVDDAEGRQQNEGERHSQLQPKELDEEALTRRERWSEAQENKKEAFLNDPEQTVKIFFSSHWRDKGYVHSKEKCKEGPILIAFFLRYLIRNRVFPEEEAALKRAAALCDRAKEELPATWTVAQTLPDRVSAGFEELNGNVTPGMFGGGILHEAADAEDEDAANDESESDVGASKEPDAKKRKLESQSEALDKMREDDPTVEAIDPNAIDHDSAAVRDAIRDNVDQNGGEAEFELKPDEQPPNSWHNFTWDQSQSANNDTVMGSWGTAAPLDSVWIIEQKNALIELLGPTALPSTHTTGVIERSTRKIAKIIRPVPAPAKNAKKQKGLTPAEAVEAELAQRLGVVVFTPWVKVGNHVASDITPPQILPDSRGKVVLPTLTKSDLLNHGLRNPPPPPPPPNDEGSLNSPFDPRSDAVHVLVDPETLDKLEPFVGMGVLATFVQIARKVEPGDDMKERPQSWDSKKKSKQRGAPGKNGEPTRWWYMESVMLSLTSFHTDRYYADQDE
ncbi:uncharacterized protein PHACADRAFT_206218 [Phanerochaete carnosa HHB-10118-sp]|uniref:Uncharacterized protein n=1 Tax=Phanerochaete carnosa (strain HHB-10118-sp) TaxID=650164 RepID=K5W7S8_PHACS|nr:uncharacterized protein PHACADRAFT_206218 [Phanerochaete carnosa HHB-10118-sp]EKM60003.1 hypothetical protein PHACADRAFT_206218 [Phanerochaete carnosa HHB-10118-sp]